MTDIGKPNMFHTYKESKRSGAIHEKVNKHVDDIRSLFKLEGVMNIRNYINSYFPEFLDNSQLGADLFQLEMSNLINSHTMGMNGFFNYGNTFPGDYFCPQPIPYGNIFSSYSQKLDNLFDPNDGETSVNMNLNFPMNMNMNMYLGLTPNFNCHSTSGSIMYITEIFLKNLEAELSLYLTEMKNRENFSRNPCANEAMKSQYIPEKVGSEFLKFESRLNSDCLSQVSYLDNQPIKKALKKSARKETITSKKSMKSNKSLSKSPKEKTKVKNSSCNNHGYFCQPSYSNISTVLLKTSLASASFHESESFLNFFPEKEPNQGEGLWLNQMEENEHSFYEVSKRKGSTNTSKKNATLSFKPNQIFIIKKVNRKQQRLKNKLPFLRYFNPQFTKRENIDKKILREFKNYIKEKISLEEEKIIGFEDAVSNFKFWLSFVNFNLIPPMVYEDEISREKLYFKSFNTNYLNWIFSRPGAEALYESFIENRGEKIIGFIVQKYDLKGTKEDNDEIHQLDFYIKNIIEIYKAPEYTTRKDENPIPLKSCQEEDNSSKNFSETDNQAKIISHSDFIFTKNPVYGKETTSLITVYEEDSFEASDEAIGEGSYFDE